MLTGRFGDYAFRIRENTRCDPRAFEVMFYQTRNVGIVFDDKNRAFHTRILAGGNGLHAHSPGNFTLSSVNSLLISCPITGALMSGKCFVFLSVDFHEWPKMTSCKHANALSSVE